MSVITVDYQSENAAAEFTASIKETGFGVIKNHPVDMKIIHDGYAAWLDYFNSANKRDFLMVDKRAQDGLVPQELAETAKGSDLRDLKEYYNYYPHGRAPDELRAITNRVCDELFTLAVTLLDWIELNLPEDLASGLSMPLSQMIQNSKRTFLRVIHYPPLTGDEELGAVRAEAHEDIDLLTCLPAASQSGLQVLTNNGTWEPIKADPSMIIINIGDMMQECTGGYFKSTTHRVINPEGEDKSKSRIATPFFLHAEDTVQLSEKHTEYSYLMERLEEQGML